MKASEILQRHLESNAKHDRLSPLGAVGAELKLQKRLIGNDAPWNSLVVAVCAAFMAKEPRLKRNHPDWWAKVLQVLVNMEAA